MSKTVESVKKTIKQPTRIITKPVEALVTDPIQQVAEGVGKTINSASTQDALAEVQGVVQSQGGQQLIGAGLAGYTGNPSFLSGAFTTRKGVGTTATTTAPRQTSAPFNPVITTESKNDLIPWVLGGVSIFGLILFLMPRKRRK